MMDNNLKESIKEFAGTLGIDIIGAAGPDRLDGPPALDPTYTMKGARSVISFALPMNVEAIYDWFTKKTPAPHLKDQIVTSQEIFRKADEIARFIRSKGHDAEPVPTNNTYRRNKDVLSTHPSFSHRFGAIAAGIAGQGWSGNVMTKEHGAAVYLSSVVTSAELESDPLFDPRYFIDNYCYPCRLCDKTCVVGMFDSQDEEQVLLNDELHPRGRRNSIHLCNASCFGLHSLSQDKKWTTWGHHWIDGWIDNPIEKASDTKIFTDMIGKGATTGDSTPRYDIIRHWGSQLIPEELMEELKENYRSDLPEKERVAAFIQWAEKVGVKGLKDDRVLTCGQCALVCGPDLQETRKRYNMLIEGGLVVPGPDGTMVKKDAYEEAVETRNRYFPHITKTEMMKDATASGVLWSKLYLGVEPKSIMQNKKYQKKLKQALERAKN